MSEHPRLAALVARAQREAGRSPTAIGIVHPCDGLAIGAALEVARVGLARPVLVGEREAILRVAGETGHEIGGLEIADSADTGTGAPAAARHAAALARDGALAMLMKGSLHTDELMAAIVHKSEGLRTDARISHAFVFDLPRYHKLLALADCVVNIAPGLPTKRHIVGNALALLRRLGIAEQKVAVLAAVETVNPAIPATVDAQALARLGADGEWPGAQVEGPFGFDNAFSARAARVKGIVSAVAGDADLMIVPELNAGNILYKSFVHVGGGDCAGLVLGARVPLVLTSRSDSLTARLASVALAVIAAGAKADG